MVRMLVELLGVGTCETVMLCAGGREVQLRALIEMKIRLPASVGNLLLNCPCVAHSARHPSLFPVPSSIALTVHAGLEDHLT
jgi:hypothetical protein